VLLLLDEPAAGLSDDEMVLLSDIIRELAAQGTAVVLVEHHVEWIKGIADRVVVMANGKPLYSGGVEDFHLDHDVREAYLGEIDA
jgi:branched-chain amino acid transport system ATP-binding protein